MMSTYHLPKFMLFAFLPTVISITVSTKYGDIKGFKVPYSSASGPFKSVSKFLGVPFAAPPTGRFRFKAPQPVKGWKPDVKEAKRHGNICIQNEKNLANLLRLFRVTDVSYSEDCLYLDVYSPNVSLSLPVMAYIHGGTYQMGTAITSQSDILALQGVVVVIIQYRLGAFGFLTTGDSAAPGNFGMLDQVEALKWIQNNIVNFGGNPDKVTIFGQSAGGSSVSLHLLSPLSKGLFHQVIAESGVDLSPFAIQTGSFGLRYAKELASKLSCSSNDHNVMVDCIRGKQAAEVQSAVEKVVFSSIDEILFAPVVDKNFLRDAPKNLRREGKFTKVPLMICFTSQEGSYFLGSFVSNSFHLMQSVSNGVSPALFMSFLSSFARAGKNSEETANLVRDALEFVYTPWPDKSDKYALRSQLVDLIGDYMFVAPSHEVADIHSQFAPVYMYEFAYAPKFSIVRTEPWMGVPHSENVRFDFGLSFLPQFRLFSSVADQNVSSLIMTMYANFARSGNPALSGVPWERYNSSHRAYLRVGTNPQTAAAFYPRRMAFWNDYHPKLMQVKFDSKAVSGASIVVTMEKCLQMILSFIFVIIAM